VPLARSYFKKRRSENKNNLLNSKFPVMYHS
jgi:hypothetical protein